ncbi:MAG: hypothetical protein LV481_15480 [Methylacidiphilales bacterium]|nr:hypothetical protein [Candidatus Methylacidiphilales bacterium]
MKSSIPGGRAGFTLVEVVLALGVTTFCLLTMVGLLAVGISTNKSTIQQSIAANIAGAAMADLRATPLANESYSTAEILYSPRFGFELPASTSGSGIEASGAQTIYVDVNGMPLTGVNSNLSTTSSAGTFRVTVVGPARPSVPSGAAAQTQRLASPVYILVTWPGQADPTATTWPTHYTGSLQVVTYLDQN